MTALSRHKPPKVTRPLMASAKNPLHIIHVKTPLLLLHSSCPFSLAALRFSFHSACKERANTERHIKAKRDRYEQIWSIRAKKEPTLVRREAEECWN